MKRLLPVLLGAGLLAVWPGQLPAADGLKLKDGDRVVLIGNTLIEREQRDGYWETALTSRYPDKNLVFRNLGWSGDTVFGHAQARFGSVAEGFRHLKEHVFALKPTVIIVGYGLNESFEGPAGLANFERGLNVLLDTLAQTKARIVLLSPLRHEDLGRPLPDPSKHNKDLALYRDVIRKVAHKRGYPFVDLFTLLGDGTKALPPGPLTDNGIHLSAYGYWRAAGILANALDLAPSRWGVEIPPVGPITAWGAKVIAEPKAARTWTITDAILPAPPLPRYSPIKYVPLEYKRHLKFPGLPPSLRYVLKIDGRPVAAHLGLTWGAGVPIGSGPEFDQVERLRKAIIAKNRLYFHRWRPQNETYLFGFRKHEQGRNAREIVQFDPLIARAEAEIARLRVPVPHKYVLVPVREKK